MIISSALYGSSQIPCFSLYKITKTKAMATNPNTPKHIISNRNTLDNTQIKLASKVMKAKTILNDKAKKDPSEGLVMIDAIQRLGIDYMFKHEIQEILNNHYKIMSTAKNHGHLQEDLYEFSLRFRLLRQQGYFVPQDVFNRFTKNKEKFKEVHGQDVLGLMELYEASQLSIRGENILDEFKVFSSNCLQTCLGDLDNRQRKVVRSRLDHPFHTNLSKFTSKDQLSNDFLHRNEWMQSFQEVAKLDFDLVHSLHKDELSQISKWWEELDFPKELKSKRKQPLQWHLWSVATLPEPSLSELRVDFTKSVFFIYILDDIFDFFGTPSELTLFAEIIKRWDYENIELLPNYMRVAFEALDSFTNEISNKVFKKHGWNPVNSLRKTWTDLCDACIIEANWFATGQWPETTEYLKNGSISCGVHVVLVLLFFLLGISITKQNVQLIDNNPTIISSAAEILRLANDLEEDENDISYIKCHMKENRGSTVDEAREAVRTHISDSWKHLNHECFYTKSFPVEFETATLNLARMVPLVYYFDDKDGFLGLQDYMKSLLLGLT